MDSWLAENEAKLIALRRHIHANPELSGKEFETTALVAGELEKAGLRPRVLPGKNGVICDVGSGDRVVALRADLDALPMHDTKDVPYRSRVDNACHACGHDVHTVGLLGAGLVLAKLAARGELTGRVRLIFQPAEESTPSGAHDVINAGGLKGVDAIFGLHCAPFVPCGVVAVRSGPLTAAADFVEIRLRGPGGHPADRHRTADLVHLAAKIVVDTPAALARAVDARSSLAVVFAAMNAGTDAGTIPEEAVLRGTVRVLDREVWRGMPSLFTRVVQEITAGSRADVEVSYTRAVPPVINDRFAAATAAAAAAAALRNPEQVVEAEFSMGGEDFAYYLEHVRGAMIRLGVAAPGAARHDIHQPEFDVDERAIGLGVRVLTQIALAATGRPAMEFGG